MKTRSLVLAALAPLVAISGANAAMDEMEAPEMRVWSAVLSEPSEESPGAALQITASKSANGSNGMVIESVALISTEVSKDDEGNMTETMSSVVCAGPIMVEGGSFMIEAAPMEEEGEMKEGDAEMADASAEGDAEMADAEGCAFSVSGGAKNRYRAWHSWDLAGSVTMGETSADFEIAGAAPAMILVPEPEPEEEMSEEAKEAS